MSSVLGHQLPPKKVAHTSVEDVGWEVTDSVFAFLWVWHLLLLRAFVSDCCLTREVGYEAPTAEQAEECHAQKRQASANFLDTP